MVTNLHNTAPIGKSHHSVLLFNFNTYNTTTTAIDSKIKIMYNKANYTEIRRHLNLYHWKTVLLNLNVNESWTYLQEQLDYLTKKYIPTKQYNTSKTCKKTDLTKKQWRR